MLSTELIPILDLSSLGKDLATDRLLGAQLGKALEEVGFYFVVNHGLPWDLVEAAYAEARRFHALPDEEKQRISMAPGKMGGYLGVGVGTSKSSTVGDGVHTPNLNEAFFAHVGDFAIGNQWPALAGFREVVERYMNEAASLARRMVPLYALALDLEPDWFDAHFESPNYTFRMSRYPPVEYGDHEWGIAPHTDSGFMTLLPTNDVPGLEIRPEGHDWIEPPAVPQSFLVNSGDILRRWTNDRFLSTAHRARNRSSVDRYSVPFFFGANGDAMVEALPTCVTASNPARYPAIRYREYQEWFGKRNYTAVTGEDAPESPP